MENKILKTFAENLEQTSSEIATALGVDIKSVRPLLDDMVERGLLAKSDRLHYVSLFDSNATVSALGRFYDWDNVIPRLEKAYNLRLPVLLTGPKGVGKTMALETMAQKKGKKLYSVNFSTQAREYHFVGQTLIQDGETIFQPGPLIRSMIEGEWLYCDEISAALPGVLLRLNEALDYRRKVEINNTVYKADGDWWCVASINPLDRFHLGNNELPGQILSRFPVRVNMRYPDIGTEYNIIKMHVPDIKEYAYDMNMFLKAANELRHSDLPYYPSIRETVSAGRLLSAGTYLDEALRMVLLDVYGQWGDAVTRKSYELIRSVVKREF
jgi:nitric oxide reductase NorQ protein